MEKERPNKRLIIGIVAIILLSIVWITNAVHLRVLERDLQVVVARKIAEFEKDNAEFTGEFRMASSVVVTKAYLLFGDIAGKSNIYRQALLDTVDTRIEGFEYWYVRDGEKWVETESARCTSEQCTVEGLKLLQALEKY